MGQSLFLIIYAAGHIGGVAGPLPYGMDGCVANRDEARSAQAKTLRTGWSSTFNRALTADEKAKIADMQFECEWRDYRPKLGDKAGT